MPFDAGLVSDNLTSTERLARLGLTPIPLEEVKEYKAKVLSNYLQMKRFEGDRALNAPSRYFSRAERIGLWAAWRTFDYQPDVRRRYRVVIPRRVRRLARRVQQHEPQALFRVHFFYSDPILEAEIEHHSHFLAIWDGRTILRSAEPLDRIDMPLLCGIRAFIWGNGFRTDL